MRKVLFIAYYFPPIGGGGVQRSAKFVKYLPEFGWQPVVISTTKSIDVEGFDESLLADIPQGVEVYRVPTPNPVPITRIDGWINRYLKRGSKNGDVLQTEIDDSSSLSPLESHTDSEPLSNIPLSSKVLKWLRRVVVWPFSPLENPPIDRYLFWSLRIVPLAIKLIRQHKIEVIYTTCPPWSVNLAGLILKKLTDVAWVADFRDPWTQNELIYHQTGWRDAVNRYFEDKTVNNANIIIGVTPLQTAGLKNLAGDKHVSKFITITNGYDDLDARRVQKLKATPSSRYKIIYGGTIYPQTIEPLLLSLTSLVVKGYIGNTLQVVFVGWLHEPIRNLITTSDAEQIIKISDRVPHDELLEMYADSAILLLLLGNTAHWSTIYSGKIFELMASGKPVLAIAPEGVAADLIRESGTGCVVHPDDVEGLTKVLQQIATDYEGFVAQYYRPNWDVIRRFDRRVLTERLAKLFGSMVA